jgi:hypothetical protein
MDTTNANAPPTRNVFDEDVDAILAALDKNEEEEAEAHFWGPPPPALPLEIAAAADNNVSDVGVVVVQTPAQHLEARRLKLILKASKARERQRRKLEKLAKGGGILKKKQRTKKSLLRKEGRKLTAKKVKAVRSPRKTKAETTSSTPVPRGANKEKKEKKQRKPPTLHQATTTPAAAAPRCEQCVKLVEMIRML